MNRMCRRSQESRSQRPGGGLLPRLILVLGLAVSVVAAGVPAGGPPPVAIPGDDVPVADSANPVVLVLDDGHRIQGELLERTSQHVVIKVAGIRTTFDAERVVDVLPVRSFEEHYEALKAGIRPDDFEQRYLFCEWIYKRRRLELAAQELEALLDDNPRLDVARELLRKINAELELEARRPIGEPGRLPDPDRSSSGRLLPTRLLTDEQVNLLKVYEIDLNNPPRLLIRRSTVERLLTEYATSELIPRTPEGKRAFYRSEPREVVDVMFRLQARDLYPEVEVLSEPASLNKFRLNVHRVWLMNSCATNLCHGGTEAGEFFLFNRRPADANVVYTNLLILERTRLNGRPMLDYDKPHESPLLQMGLPRDRSVFPHPPVDGWTPVFRDQSDPMFTRAVDWLRSMYRPRPDYPIEYEPPLVTYERERPEDGGRATGREANDKGDASEDEPTGRPRRSMGDR